jgi:hypothetical protein
MAPIEDGSPSEGKRMGKQSKVEKAIRAARKLLDAGNYIGAVKVVRERYPERGLKDTKDFTDWVRSNDEGNANHLARTWCEECWDIFPCEHTKQHAATTCGFDTGVGVCGHPLTDGRCKFINHNGRKTVSQ